MTRFKMWMQKKWLRFRAWFAGILLAIVGVTGVMVTVAGTKDFTWENPTQNTDGSVFNPETDQRETRIYCETGGIDVPVMVIPGVQTAYTGELATGEYTCYATVVSNEGAESFPSNSVTFTVDPLIPNPPVLNP